MQSFGLFAQNIHFNCICSKVPNYMSKMAKLLPPVHQIFKIIALSFAILLLFDYYMPICAEKGRDIIISNGKIILKGGKKKGNIIISSGDGGHGQGSFKYKKKYMNYGGYWRK